MPRLGRPPTGSLVWRDGKPFGVRVTLKDKSRRVIPFGEEVTEERANVLRKVLAKRAHETGAVPAETKETVDEWFDRWLAAREKKGLRSTRTDRGRFHKWISPCIGGKAITEITRRDLEEIVQRLDEAVRKSSSALDNAFKWKTASNVWGVVTKMFADACRSKVLDLRVREDNPAREIEGPDRGVERSGPYLFPSEFEALILCDRVPARWRRIFTLATYLYVRRGELEALEWNSVNFDQRYILIHQAVDADSGDVKSTKTKDVRKVPIEPSLMPLLEHMRRESNGEGRVFFAMPPRESVAERLRKYLDWAGVKRADLFADDETRRPLSFHDLRHTGITWRAMRGDEPLKIMRAAGHDDLRTTQRYINEAQTFDLEGFGEVFPAFPLQEFSPFVVKDRLSALSASNAVHSAKFDENLAGFRGRPQRESNPDEIAEANPPKTTKDAEAVQAPDDTHGLSASLKPELDAVEAALAMALEAATREARWDIVSQLARELEARRMARSGNVVPLRKREAQ